LGGPKTPQKAVFGESHKTKKLKLTNNNNLFCVNHKRAHGTPNLILEICI
jgi:hypothetical protein